MEKKYRVHLTNGKTDLFKLKQSSGRFQVYVRSGTGIFSDDYRHIGDARSEDDAVQIMKANASGSISKISID